MQLAYNNSLVSIVVITFNSSKYVLETLNSVRDQTYEQIELIISDDCSDDETVEICNQWIAKHKCRFTEIKLIVSDRNTGIAQNCNRGILVSKGEWIKIIAGDDALEPDIISCYINFSRSTKGVVAITSQMQAYKDLFCPDNILKIKSAANRKFNSPETVAHDQFKILLRYNCVSAPTVMLKKEILEKLGGFDENFPFLEDWPMWLSMTNAGYKMHYVDKISVKYRIHASSIQNLIHKKNYMSLVEIEVDKMFVNKYLKHLPFLEKIAKLLIIYRNKLIRNLFGNRNNYFISILSITFGAIPIIVLRQYRKRYL